MLYPFPKCKTTVGFWWQRLDKGLCKSEPVDEILILRSQSPLFQMFVAKPRPFLPPAVSAIPKMKVPLALGVFSPVPAPRVAWKRHGLAAGKPGPVFEDLPAVVLEEAGPKKPVGVPPLSPKPPTGAKKAGGAALPLLRRALHNESAKKQKVRADEKRTRKGKRRNVDTTRSELLNSVCE